MVFEFTLTLLLLSCGAFISYEVWKFMIIMSLVNIFILFYLCVIEIHDNLVSERGPTFHIPLLHIHNWISIYKKSWWTNLCVQVFHALTLTDQCWNLVKFLDRVDIFFNHSGYGKHPSCIMRKDYWVTFYLVWLLLSNGWHRACCCCCCCSSN